jgi:hypothetical protein
MSDHSLSTGGQTDLLDEVDALAAGFLPTPTAAEVRWFHGRPSEPGIITRAWRALVASLRRPRLTVRVPAPPPDAPSPEPDPDAVHPALRDLIAWAVDQMVNT